MLAARFAQGLQFHGRLPLIADSLPHADQGGHGVKKPAHGTRGHAVETPIELTA